MVAESSPIQLDAHHFVAEVRDTVRNYLLLASRCERGCGIYLIPFATHAFVFERQERASELPSLLVFPMISTDFTPTP